VAPQTDTRTPSQKKRSRRKLNRVSQRSVEVHHNEEIPVSHRSVEVRHEEETTVPHHRVEVRQNEENIVSQRSLGKI